MDNIITQIKEERTLKPSTIKQYKTNISKIFDMFNDGNITTNFDFLKDIKTIMKKIGREKITQQKNRIGMILVLLGLDKDKYEKEIDEYRDIAQKLRTEHDGFIDKQIKTEKQEKNWIDYKQYMRLLNKYKREIKKAFAHNHTILNKKHYTLLQEYLFLLLFNDFPFRNIYGSIKIIEADDYKKIEDEHSGNWLILKNGTPHEFIIHEYKTSGSYGMKTISLKKKKAMINAIKVWLKYNKSGYLFTQTNDRTKPHSSNSFTRFVQNIFLKEFNKKIGTTLLRNIIISHEKKNEPSILEKQEKEQEIEDKYHHSSKMNDKYAKKD
jgi:hypothetical protein